ncbi:MAG TPA: molybdenum ABC transporter ATP-binding protein [Steroidobacteraceae bacterium]|nr:molybdenum ABC transporter ATP-binding protein [Steroidobacteraceae bacterium]
MLKVAVLKRLGSFTLRAQFEAPTPGVVALFGRSGSGKTTTVNILAGLLAPDAGRVELNGSVLEDTATGMRIAAERRCIGYVFQEPRLFPHLSVLGNLQYGQKRAAPAAQPIELERVVALLGLKPLLRRRPHQLSGGERQRASLGRALLSQPRLLLLDEPLASLDVARREEVLPYLELLRDSLSIPMVYVSHQLDEVLRLATYVVLLEGGRVAGQGTVNEISLLPPLRSLVGPDAVGAVVDGQVTRFDGTQRMAELQVGRGKLHVSVREVTAGTRVRVHLLARDIILGLQEPKGLSVRNALQGTIVELLDDDHETVLVKVDIGAATIVLARITRSAAVELALRPGMSIWVLVKAVSTRGHAFRLSGASGDS